MQIQPIFFLTVKHTTRYAFIWKFWPSQCSAFIFLNSKSSMPLPGSSKGLVVREGASLSSEEAAERLQCGATIQAHQSWAFSWFWTNKNRRNDSKPLCISLVCWFTSSFNTPNDGFLQELELNGTRLRYQLVSGSGPPSGWISTQLKGVDLLAALRGAGGVRVDHGRSPRAAEASELPGAVCCLVGDLELLGNWDPKRAVKLKEKKKEKGGLANWFD